MHVFAVDVWSHQPACSVSDNCGCFRVLTWERALRHSSEQKLSVAIQTCDRKASNQSVEQAKMFMIWIHRQFLSGMKLRGSNTKKIS